MPPTTEPQAKNVSSRLPCASKGPKQPTALSLHSLPLSSTLSHAKGFSSASACAVEGPAFSSLGFLRSLGLGNHQPEKQKRVIPTEAADRLSPHSLLSAFGPRSGGIVA